MPNRHIGSQISTIFFERLPGCHRRISQVSKSENRYVGLAFGALTHDQGSRGGNLIGKTDLSYPKWSAKKVIGSNFVPERRRPCDPKGHADRSVAPGAPDTVDDYDADAPLEMFLEQAPQPGAGGIRVIRKQKNALTAVLVRA